MVHDLHRLSCIERCTRAHQEAGVLSYLALHLLISLSFRKCGSIPGNNVLSVLSRANYLDEKDLDSAAYELDQLAAIAKELLCDRLQEAAWKTRGAAYLGGMSK